MSYTGHPYWERFLGTPIIQVYVLSTNEPQLGEVLGSLARQDYPSYKVWVIQDCIAENHTGLVYKHLFRDKFTFILSPYLQGLTRAVNTALTDRLQSRYLFITGAEYVYPPDALSIFAHILDSNPHYILGPNLQGVPNFDRFAPSWAYFMRKHTAKQIGPWAQSFGPGGVGSAHDWMIRAWKEGYEFKAVQDVKVEYTPYSIQDKISDWKIVEGREEWALRYGGDVMKPAESVPGFKGWEWIDKEGNPC